MTDAKTRDSRDDEELKRRVMKNLDRLDKRGKLEVLDLSERLSSGDKHSTGSIDERDTRGALLAYAGTIPRDDLDRMTEAIEEGCERVDEEGW